MAVFDLSSPGAIRGILVRGLREVLQTINRRSLYNHGEGPYYGLLLVENRY